MSKDSSKIKKHLQYKNLSEEEKNKKCQYGYERYKNLPKNEKQSLKFGKKEMIFFDHTGFFLDKYKKCFKALCFRVTIKFFFIFFLLTVPGWFISH